MGLVTKLNRTTLFSVVFLLVMPPAHPGNAQEVSTSPGHSVTAQTTFTFFYGKRLTFRTVGVPQRWANVLGNVNNPSGIDSLTYSLNGGPSRKLRLGPDTRRLFNNGDFNIDLSWSQLSPLPDSNRVVVTAASQGNFTKDTVVVRYQSGTHWPIPCTVSWSSSPDIMASAQVVDGQWFLESGGVRNVDLGYDRLIAIGDTTWTDYQVTVPITMHSINPAGYNPTSGQPAVGIFLRWIGHTDDPFAGWQPKTGYYPSGALGMYAFNTAQNGGERLEIWTDVHDTSGGTIPLGQTMLYKMQVRTQANGDLYSLRVWHQGTPEPAVWDLIYLDQAKKAARGSLLLLSHYVDATFGDVEVAPTEPVPVQLAQFTGLATGIDRVQLYWRTLSETNNYGFEVERAPDQPVTFTALPGSFVAGHGTTIEPHDYGFTDTGVGAGVWYYRLKQVDLDGTTAYHEPIRVSVGDVTSSRGEGVATDFSLYQNYPNPFNPSTTIRYALPRRAHVKLTVYNTLGQHAATLVDEEKDAGYHEVQLSARAGTAFGGVGYTLSSGTYFYRLHTNDPAAASGQSYDQTRTFVLMK